MKKIKKTLLLMVLLINICPYMKEGVINWTTTQMSAQTYTVEGMIGNLYKCVNTTDPTDWFPTSFADCHQATICKCAFCGSELNCGTPCSNSLCPSNIPNSDECSCCGWLQNISGECINMNCMCSSRNPNSPNYKAPSTSDGGGGGGGGGGDGTGGSSTYNSNTARPTINLLNASKWQLQLPNECKNACDAYNRRAGLTDVGSRSNVYRLTYQDATGSHPYGTSSNSLNTVVTVLDRHLGEGRGITVGLDYRRNSSNDDGTDHFVVITGRGYDSINRQYYYTYMDPGRGNSSLGCDTNTNRLYVDTTTNTIHGYRPNDKWGNEYSLTHIRPNDGNYTGSTTY